MCAEILRTERLVIRDWADDDAAAALAVYGRAEVARWLSPAVDRVTGEERHAGAAARMDGGDPGGRGRARALGDRPPDSGVVVGGVSLHLLPVEEQDVEIGWQLAPEHWGHGYAVEAGRHLVERAFGLDIDEVFALVRPNNTRGEATARRLGMTWVGETDKYYGLRLNVFRMRPSDDPIRFHRPAE